MGGASVLALFYTGGNVSKLVVMYSINVFLTFSLSEFGMSRFWIKHRKEHPKEWYRHLPIHLTGLTLCLTILVVTVLEKFTEGGWLTLIITGLLVGVCALVKSHYREVGQAIRRLDVDLPAPKLDAQFDEGPPPERSDPIAVLFVGGYSGLGRHALMTLLRMFPRHFKGVVFVSVAVVDSDVFKGDHEVAALEERTKASLTHYERLARSFGLAASSTFAVGTEVPPEAERLATETFAKYPNALVVAGQLVFDEDTFWTRLLHNETAFSIQRRLQKHGVPMVVVPVRLDKSREDAPASVKAEV
jgi:hypothetical protein